MKPAWLSGLLRVEIGRQAGARSMGDIAAVPAHWQLDMRHVRERMYRAPTPRSRERWRALWLLARGRSANKVAELLEREAHTVGAWLAIFERDGPATLAFEQSGAPPALGAEAQAGLKVAVQAALLRRRFLLAA